MKKTNPPISKLFSLRSAARANFEKLKFTSILISVRPKYFITVPRNLSSPDWSSRFTFLLFRVEKEVKTNRFCALDRFYGRWRRVGEVFSRFYFRRSFPTIIIVFIDWAASVGRNSDRSRKMKFMTVQLNKHQLKRPEHFIPLAPVSADPWCNWVSSLWKRRLSRKSCLVLGISVDIWYSLMDVFI